MQWSTHQIVLSDLIGGKTLLTSRWLAVNPSYDEHCKRSDTRTENTSQNIKKYKKALMEILVGETRHWNLKKSNWNSNCTKLDV